MLDNQYSPTKEGLAYVSSVVGRKIELTDATTPKDISRLLMTKDEFDFISTYYYSIRRMQEQEELQRLLSFMEKHGIQFIFIGREPPKVPISFYRTMIF